MSLLSGTRRRSNAEACDEALEQETDSMADAGRHAVDSDSGAGGSLTSTR
jgi:hypothetical protein